MDDQLVQNFHKQKKLPFEIIYIILLYLRQPQSANLLEDISSFSKTIPIITNKYYKKWIIEWQSEEGEDINWLENDLILYANEYAPTGQGMKPKYLLVFLFFLFLIKVFLFFVVFCFEYFFVFFPPTIFLLRAFNLLILSSIKL